MIPSKKSLLKLDERDELNEPFDKFEKTVKNIRAEIEQINCTTHPT